MKFTEINGRRFETVKSVKAEELMRIHLKLYSGKTLYTAYRTPSAKKIAVYEGWREWLHNADEVEYFEVVSKSPYTFSLGAIYTNGYPDYEPLGYIHITPAHNRLFLVV